MTTPRKKLIAGLLISVPVTLMSLFALDRTLAIINPVSASIRFANPPHITTTQTSIEFSCKFQTNSDGFRDDPFPRSKKPGEVRIFAAGDSFVEGYGVEADQRFTSLLRDTLSSAKQPVTILNGGLTGTGPSTYSYAITKAGLIYDPDVVLMCIYANDLMDTPIQPPTEPEQSFIRKIPRLAFPQICYHIVKISRYREYRRKMVTRDFIQTICKEAEKKGVPDERVEAWLKNLPQELVSAVNQNLFNGSILSYGLLNPSYWKDSLDMPGTIPEEHWLSLRNIILQLQKTASKKNARLGVVFLPCVFQYDPESHSPDNPWIRAGSVINSDWLTNNTPFQNKLADLTRTNNIPFLDLTPAFRTACTTNHNLSWKLDGHWTPQGHALAAKTLEPWIREQFLTR